MKAGDNRFSQPLGDGIRAIAWLNYDKGDQLDASSPVNLVTIASDKINFSRTENEIMSEMYITRGLISAETVYRRHCFIIYDGELGNLNGVNLDMLLNGANITAGNNVLVVWRHTASKGLVAFAHMREEYDKMVRLGRHGLPQDPNILAYANAFPTIDRVN
jgi:hypothetical protein